MSFHSPHLLWLLVPPVPLFSGELARKGVLGPAKLLRAMDSDTIEKTFTAIDCAQKIEFQARSYLLTTGPVGPRAVLLFLRAVFASRENLIFLRSKKI